MRSLETKPLGLDLPEDSFDLADFLERVPGACVAALQGYYTYHTKGEVLQFVSFLFDTFDVEEDFVDADIIPELVRCLGFPDEEARGTSAWILFSLLDLDQHREAVLSAPGLFEALESLEETKCKDTAEFELLSLLKELRSRGEFANAARAGSGASSAGEAQQVGSRAS